MRSQVDNGTGGCGQSDCRWTIKQDIQRNSKTESFQLPFNLHRDNKSMQETQTKKYKGKSESLRLE